MDLLRNNGHELTPCERRFRAIIQSSPVAMVMVGRGGGIELFNAEAERIFGYTREEILSQPVEHLLPEQYRQGHAGLRSEYLHAPQARVMGSGRDLVARRKDGSEFPVEIGLNPLELEGETWILCTLVDISARKQAELALRESEMQLEASLRELREAQQELVRGERLATLGQLAGSLAHEIRTPLCVLQNGVFFLEESLPSGDETLCNVLAEMKRAVGRSDRIITDMLDYVREPNAHDAVFPAGQAVLEALQQVTLPDTIRLHASNGDEFAVHGSQDQVTSILVNLIQNAVQAMPQGGELELSTGRDDDDGKVCIQVRDTGCGIAQENLARIFEPLFSTKTTGIGLGLAIAQRYALLNGGELTVESEVDRGTTFRLLLNRAT